jgi:hypothetical protein
MNKYGECWYYDTGRLKHEITALDDEYWYDEVGRFHRANGPAIIWINAAQKWYQHGKYHRIDGPAIEFANGNKEWYIEGTQIFCKDNEEFLRIVKIKYLL